MVKASSTFTINVEHQRILNGNSDSFSWNVYTQASLYVYLWPKRREKPSKFVKNLLIKVMYQYIVNGKVFNVYSFSKSSLGCKGQIKLKLSSDGSYYCITEIISHDEHPEINVSNCMLYGVICEYFFFFFFFLIVPYQFHFIR